MNTSVSNAEHVYDDKTLSVILTFRQGDPLEFFEETVFSLAIQWWIGLEVIIVSDEGSFALWDRIKNCVNSQPWLKPPSTKFITDDVSSSETSRYIKLVNQAIAIATGRYLAVIGCDGVIYQHGYTTLIGRLQSGSKAIAIGGCRLATLKCNSNHWYVAAKDTRLALLGQSRIDIFRANFVPVHSYVIDRARIGTFRLYLDEDLSPFEDYDFLLRLCAEYDPDLFCFDIPVCEYRIHPGNSWITTTPLHVTGRSKQAHERLCDRKKTLLCAISAAELANLGEQLRDLRQELERIKIQNKKARGRVRRSVSVFLDKAPGLKILIRTARLAWRTFDFRST
jgi:hypothetical protein